MSPLPSSNGGSSLRSQSRIASRDRAEYGHGRHIEGTRGASQALVCGGQNTLRRAVRTCSLRGSACAGSKAKSPPPGGNRGTSRPQLALRGTTWHKINPYMEWWGVVPSLPKGCAFLGLGPICTGCRGPVATWVKTGENPAAARRAGGKQRRHAGPVRLRARHPLLGRGSISPALSSHPRRSGSSSSNRLFWRVYVVRSSGTVGPIFLREGSRSHLRNGFVQPLVVVVLDEASEGLHPRSPFAVHPVGPVPPLKRERRCGRLEPSWLPPCTWACDCLGRFSSPVPSSTLRCVGFAPPGERLAQTLPVDHRDRQPGSCRSLAGSCSYSRIARSPRFVPFLAAHSPSDA